MKGGGRWREWGVGAVRMGWDGWGGGGGLGVEYNELKRSPDPSLSKA